MTKAKLTYIKANWKLGVHLTLRTKRFGVNNKWWCSFDSIFGIRNRRIILNILLVWPVYQSYKFMKIRAVGCCLMAPEERKMMGW